jgi:FSR family fosmidomycin resistance protein-like MFS transporter
VFGVREAAWPLIRDDLSLSYAEIGLLLSIPGLVSVAVEPAIGLLAVTWRRRALVVGGGIAFAGALALAAAAQSAGLLLLAFAVLYPASGAFVSLSQASLMDLEPGRREHNMTRWTVAGSIGAIAGPLLLAGAAWVGLGWRGLFSALAMVTLVLLLRPAPSSAAEAEPLRVREALRAVARCDVLRWLLLLEVADLLLDVFAGFLALYLVDVAGASHAAAGLAVGLWAGAGLAGSAAMIPLLRRMDGLRYLRVSAVAAAVLLGAFLVVPGTGAKLAVVALLGVVNAGWYPVLQSRLYDALGGASGLVLTVSMLFPLYAVLPIGIAAVAERWGLTAALWPLLAAPAALLALVPRPAAPTPEPTNSPPASTHPTH